MNTAIEPVSNMTGSPVEQLKKSPLFKSISEADLQALVQVMKPQAFAAGALLFKKGDPGDAMYIILAGRVRIFTTDTGGQAFTLTYYGPGRVFGDFSLLDQQPRSASASVEEPLEALVLSRDDFMAFLPQHPSIGLAMIRHLTDRLRYITIYLNRVTAFGQWLSEGNYEQALAELSDPNTGDEEIDTLIAAFMEMIHNVREREQSLSVPSGQDN
jgi:CRP-like cAMP-binding protein